MNDNIRRRALLATAKVALSFTVMGCGTVVVMEEPVPPISDDPVEQPPEEEPQQLTEMAHEDFAEEVEELMCQAPPVGSEVPLEDEELVACCVDELLPQLTAIQANNEPWSDFVNAAEQDLGMQACCSVLLAANDASISGGQAGIADWGTLQPCCATVDTGFGPTCAPWGPPVPPAMLRLLDDLDQLALPRVA